MGRHCIVSKAGKSRTGTNKIFTDASSRLHLEDYLRRPHAFDVACSKREEEQLQQRAAGKGMKLEWFVLLILQHPCRLHSTLQVETHSTLCMHSVSKLYREGRIPLVKTYSLDVSTWCMPLCRPLPVAP